MATFPLWGGTASVAVSAPAGRVVADVALDAVRSTCEAFDRACSLFRHDSELVWLNRRAGDGPVRIGPVLLDAVLAGLRGARLTHGDVAPAFGRPRTFPLDGRALVLGGVRVDREAGTVELPAGVRLDLGATAKALAADRAAAGAFDAIRASGAGGGVLVGLLGDLACAGPAPQGGWPVRVVGDHRTGAAPGQTITLVSGGLATSSRLPRGEHILDPATGAPVRSDLLVASVAGASCLDANIAATAAIVRGWSAASAWLRSQSLPARLVRADGLVGHLGGWPQDGEELPLAVAA